MDLSDRGDGLWRAVLADYDLSAAERELLAEACRALDRADEARAVLDRDGIVTTDRYGSPRTHPMCDVEARARSFYATAIKQLGVKLVELSLRSGGRTGPRSRSQAESARQDGY